MGLWFMGINLSLSALAHLPTERTGHGEDVLIATPAHIHADDMIAGKLTRDLGDMGQGVRGLQRRDDALGLTAELKRIQSLGIGARNILRPTDIVEPSMLGPDPGIIQASRN